VNLLQKEKRKREKIHSFISSADEDELKIEKGGEIRFCESIDNKTSAKNNIFFHMATLVNRVESEQLYTDRRIIVDLFVHSLLRVYSLFTLPSYLKEFYSMRFYFVR
jgi:hypothetical protein